MKSKTTWFWSTSWTAPATSVLQPDSVGISELPHSDAPCVEQALLSSVRLAGDSGELLRARSRGAAHSVGEHPIDGVVEGRSRALVLLACPHEGGQGSTTTHNAPSSM